MALCASISISCISVSNANWKNVYNINIFTKNNPYYMLLTYFLFHLNHPVYSSFHSINISMSDESTKNKDTVLFSIYFCHYVEV